MQRTKALLKELMFELVENPPAGVSEDILTQLPEEILVTTI